MLTTIIAIWIAVGALWVVALCRAASEPKRRNPFV